MNRILTVLLIIAALAVSRSCAAPNVLFIISDDLTAEALSCYVNV